MITSIIVTVLAILTTIWNILKIVSASLKYVGKGLVYVGKGFWYVSRIPGDMLLAILKSNGWFPEGDCKEPLTAMIYLLSSLLVMSGLVLLLFKGCGC